MLKLLKKIINGEQSLIGIIEGDNQPSIILVDLICTKILINLDNIDFKEAPPLKGESGQVSFTWKVDDIVVAGSCTIAVRRITTGGNVSYERDNRRDYFSVEPQIKVHGVKHELNKSEQQRLWRTMLKAGRMKVKRDAERAEYNRQRLAVEAIGNMGGRESDIVKRAKELSEQALLKLAPPPKSREDELEEAFATTAIVSSDELVKPVSIRPKGNKPGIL